MSGCIKALIVQLSYTGTIVLYEIQDTIDVVIYMTVLLCSS